MIENQEELRTALEKIRAQKEIIKQLKAADTAGEDSCTQLESLQKRVRMTCYSVYLSVCLYFFE